MTTPPPNQRRQRRMFDMTIPITWVLSCLGGTLMLLGSILWNVAGQSGKLDDVLRNQVKTEARLDARDNKIEAYVSATDQRISTVERQLDKHELRLDGVERILRIQATGGVK